MKEIFDFAENVICKECRRIKKEKYPNSIGCAFKCIDNEYCDEVINLMKMIYEK